SLRWHYPPLSLFEVARFSVQEVLFGFQSAMVYFCRLIPRRIQAQPFENFHQAAIFLYQDAQNCVAINRGYCEPCGGTGIYIVLLCKNYANHEDSCKTLPRSHADTEIKNSAAVCVNGERFWLRLEAALRSL
ncbi:MAG: hypothetical protein ACOYYJ_06795, partial [Chloroflexota bacterium]